MRERRSLHSHPFRRTHQWMILGVLLAAFVLFLYQLDGQSLWRDEALSIARARQPLTRIFAGRNLVDGVESPDLHPPLYFLILHGWRLLAGESEFSLRLPSSLAGLLSLAMFYALGKRIWGSETGLWASLLATISPFFWWYAQEARMYSLIVFESLLLLYTLWPLLAGRAKWTNYLTCSLAAVLLIFTHYSGVFAVLFAITAYLIALWQRRFQWRMLLIPLLIGLLGLLLLYPHLDELLSLPEFFSFSQRPLLTLAQEAVNTFSLGSTIPKEDPGWWLVPFIGLAAVGALTLNISSRSRRWWAALVGVGSFVLPLLLFFAASWLKANYSNPRHLTTLSAPWYLLMGHGLATMRQRWWPLALLFGLGALSAGGISLYQTVVDPPILKDDVRGLAQFVEQRMQPGDLLLWHDAVMMVTYDYYALELPYDAVPPYGWLDESKVIQRLSDLAQQYERIWFVEMPGPAYFDDDVVSQWLQARLVHTEFVTFPASWASLHLHLYQWPEMSADPPQGAFPADLQDGPYHVHGVGTDQRAVTSPGTWFSLWWSGQDYAADRPSACLRLLDSAGVSWSEECAVLNAPGNLATDGQIIKQQLWLPIPDGLAPVPYQLALIFGDSEQQVATIAVQPSPRPLAQEPAARFDDGPELLTIQWTADVFRAGLWAVGNPIWYTDAPIERELTVNVRLVDWLGRVITSQSSPLGPADYPGEQWRPGDQVRSFWGIPLPFSMDGRYRAQVSITEADGTPLSARGWGGTWSSIGWIQIEPWPMMTDLPPHVVQRPEAVYFGDSIRLAGYELRREGEILTVKLYWQSEEAIDRDYGVFVHVGRQGSPPVAQADGGPAGWTRPTTSWRKGEIIEDTHTIRLPPPMSSEELSVFAGLYDIDDPDSRLPAVSAGISLPHSAFRLGNLPVEE